MKQRKSKSERAVAAICYFVKMAGNQQSRLLNSTISAETKLFKLYHDSKVEQLSESWVVLLARIIPDTLMLHCCFPLT